MKDVFWNSNIHTKLEIKKTLCLQPQRGLPLGNKNYCNVTRTKVPIFSVIDDAFPLSQYCIKTYSKNNLTNEEIFLNNRLSGKRRITENVFEMYQSLFVKGIYFFYLLQYFSLYSISLYFSSLGDFKF